jgi:hypothetical protein
MHTAGQRSWAWIFLPLSVLNFDLAASGGPLVMGEH